MTCCNLLVVDEQQQEELAAAVRAALARRNMTVNSASIRLRMDRQALTRFVNGVPMSLELVEKWARGVREDVNKWRELAGYDPVNGHLVGEITLSDFVNGAEILAAGLRDLEAKYGIPDLPLRFRSGLSNLTVEEARSVLADLEQQLKDYQQEKEQQANK
jgi:hypothetical protein